MTVPLWWQMYGSGTLVRSDTEEKLRPPLFTAKFGTLDRKVLIISWKLGGRGNYIISSIGVSVVWKVDSDFTRPECHLMNKPRVVVNVWVFYPLGSV